MSTDASVLSVGIKGRTLSPKLYCFCITDTIKALVQLIVILCFFCRPEKWQISQKRSWKILHIFCQSWHGMDVTLPCQSNNEPTNQCIPVSEQLTWFHYDYTCMQNIVIRRNKETMVFFIITGGVNNRDSWEMQYWRTRNMKWEGGVLA